MTQKHCGICSVVVRPRGGVERPKLCRGCQRDEDRKSDLVAILRKYGYKYRPTCGESTFERSDGFQAALVGSSVYAHDGDVDPVTAGERCFHNAHELAKHLAYVHDPKRAKLYKS